MIFVRGWKILLVVWIGFFGLGGEALAQKVPQKEAPTKLELDLEACIRQALTSNPQMAEARLDVRRSEWELRSAKLARTPKMELFNIMGVTEDAEGNAITGRTIDGEYGFFNRLDLDIVVPLYTFGRIKQSIEAANQNINVQKASEAKTKNDLVVRVHKLYYGLLLARELLDSTEELQSSFAEARDIAEERLDEGDASVTEADVLKLQVGLAGVTEGLRKLERETQVTKEALRETLALGEKTEFDIADKRLKPVEYELKPLDDYLLQARENNPNVRQVKAAVVAQEAKYLAEKSKYYPTLLAVGGVKHGYAPGREDQDNPFLNDSYNYTSAGGALGLKWNLNFFETNAQVEKERVNHLRTKAKLQQGLDGIDLLVKQNYYRVKEKQANLETALESRKAGRGLMFLSLTNWKLGIGTGKDVFESLSVYARTAGNYAEALFDYNVSVIELQSVVGLPLDKYYESSSQKKEE